MNYDLLPFHPTQELLFHISVTLVKYSMVVKLFAIRSKAQREQLQVNRILVFRSDCPTPGQIFIKLMTKMILFPVRQGRATC